MFSNEQVLGLQGIPGDPPEGMLGFKKYLIGHKYKNELNCIM